MTFKLPALATIPSIAQLVERWTVVVLCQISIGRWFKSGSKEFLFFLTFFFSLIMNVFKYIVFFFTEPILLPIFWPLDKINTTIMKPG